MKPSSLHFYVFIFDCTGSSLFPGGSSLVSAGVTSVVVVSWILSSCRVLSPLWLWWEARLYVLQRGSFLGAKSGSYSLVVASGFSRVAVEGSSRVVAGDSGHLLSCGDASSQLGVWMAL